MIQAQESRQACKNNPKTEKDRSYSDQEPAAANETTTHGGVSSMSNTIKSPRTMQEFFKVADDIGIDPSALLELLNSALGKNWWKNGLGEAALTTTNVPHGFKPLDEVVGSWAGEWRQGERWTVITEWNVHTGEFSCTPWTHDNESMTSEETLDYAAALVQMASYITEMETSKPAEESNR